MNTATPVPADVIRPEPPGVQLLELAMIRFAVIRARKWLRAPTLSLLSMLAACTGPGTQGHEPQGGVPAQSGGDRSANPEEVLPSWPQFDPGQRRSPGVDFVDDETGFGIAKTCNHTE